jgi:hypothetical protein
MAEYDRSATGPLPVDAGPRRAESIFDLSPEDFRASLGELQAMGHDTDALMRQYRARNSPFAPINNAAEAHAQGLADSGRSSVLGGLLSKPEGATGMDAIMGLEREGWRGLLGAGQQVGQAFDAPAAVFQGVVPDQDVNFEALNTAGMAMGAGGAATAPSGALRSGLAREAGLSEAQRQARDVLDMRAAGRAGDVTDDMMARADPQYMFDNTPLPMDEASRLARADAGGFGVNAPQYHATTADFSSFQPSQTGLAGRGVYSGSDPSDVVDYVSPEMIDGLWQDRRDGVRVIPMLTPPEGTYARKIQYQDALDADDSITHASGGMDLIDAQRRVADGLSEQGYSGVRSMPGHLATFDPTNIRSRFARFDPEFAHLSNLSAANASPTAGLLASGAQEKDKPLPFMEMLRGLLR